MQKSIHIFSCGRQLLTWFPMIPLPGVHAFAFSIAGLHDLHLTDYSKSDEMSFT